MDDKYECNVALNFEVNIILIFFLYAMDNFINNNVYISFCNKQYNFLVVI